MIEKIKMQNYATFDENGANINNCSKINFIYGANGSGKTTISNYLQNQDDLKYNSCSIDWDINQPMEILVYNRAFKEKNFSEEIDGIFTLGEAAINDITKINELKDLRQKRKNELNNKKRHKIQKTDELEKRKNDFKDDVWNAILKNNENYFQEAFKGYRASKDKFFEQVLKQYYISGDSSYTQEELIEKSKKLFSKKPEKCNHINLNLDNMIYKINEIENNSIWNKCVIGNQDVPIAKLISYLNNADWIKNGIIYIKDSSKCPFCQQETITDNFKNQLNQFFSGEYENDMQTITDLKIKYSQLTSYLLNDLEAILSVDNYFEISKIKKEDLVEKIELIKLNINDNINKITAKETEPSKRNILKETTVYNITLLLTKGNENINEHNNIVDNFNEERDKIISDIWSFLINNQKTLISNYLNEKSNIEKAINGISKSIESFEAEITNIDNKIIEINKNMTNTQTTVDEINRLLSAYGFNNFKIVQSQHRENSYQIQRPDGTPANNTLSEGEETFISFLYFLQLTKGAKDISKVSTEKILIVDDPICSLDSTILYIVSTLVKDLIKDIKENTSNIKQIFILTHNAFFHKEVSFINGNADTSNDVSYWIIHKNETTSTITEYGHYNPIHTSYELLWNEIRDTSSSFITIQNTMRRIIENYFGMLGNRKYDYIKNKFSTIEEKQICDSLFYWINDGSHSLPDDLYIDSYSDSIEKYKKVFREIFVKSDNIAHYNMMMKIQDSNQNNEQE